VMEGTDIEVGSHATTNLALLLHEFVTNAAKYGALSIPEGRLHIAITILDHTLYMTWTEKDGPSVATPDGVGGFGSKLEQTIKASLKGTVMREWRPEGLVIRLSVPVAAIQKPTT